MTDDAYPIKTIWLLASAWLDCECRGACHSCVARVSDIYDIADRLLKERTDDVCSQEQQLK